MGCRIFYVLSDRCAVWYDSVTMFAFGPVVYDVERPYVRADQVLGLAAELVEHYATHDDYTEAALDLGLPADPRSLTDDALRVFTAVAAVLLTKYPEGWAQQDEAWLRREINRERREVAAWRRGADAAFLQVRRALKGDGS